MDWECMREHLKRRRPQSTPDHGQPPHLQLFTSDWLFTADLMAHCKDMQSGRPGDLVGARNLPIIWWHLQTQTHCQIRLVVLKTFRPL